MPLDSLVGPLAAFLAPAGPPLVPTPQYHGEGLFRTSVHLGLRQVQDDFEPAEEHSVFGLVLDVREAGRSEGFEVGLLRSSGDGRIQVGAGELEAESVIWELFVGARWSFDPWSGPLRPHLGVGGSLLYAEFDVSGLGGSDSNSGWAVGVYGGGGIEWRFSDDWAVGLDLRLLYSTPATLQEEAPLDYVQAALTLSWAW
ncbi:MAG: outer membrane beta-barrel protein [Planctomycetes bacterium]|nr:outer membrane beta-barrel protein [Planctomycetota bacterium]